MKVKINQAMASAEFAYYKDEVHEVEDTMAEKWVESGLASKVEEKTQQPPERKEPETATRKQPETAAMPSGKNIRR